MENGFYSIMKDPAQVAVAVRGIEHRGGMIRMALMNSRHVNGADGYLHDEYFWVPQGEWMSISDQQAAFLAARPVSVISRVEEA